MQNTQDEINLILPEEIHTAEKPDKIVPKASSLNNIKNENLMLPVETKYNFDNGLGLTFDISNYEWYEYNINRLLEIYPLKDSLINNPNYESILKFCIWGMWRLTGKHQSPKPAINNANELINIDNPVITKCIEFNNAFVLLFKSVCKRFNKLELLKKYKMFMVTHKYSLDLQVEDNEPEINHAYIGVLTRDITGYKVVVIDPYHTSLHASAHRHSPEVLFSRLDFTSTRVIDALLELNNIQGITYYDKPDHLAFLIEMLYRNKSQLNSKIVSRIIGVVETFRGLLFAKKIRKEELETKMRGYKENPPLKGSFQHGDSISTPKLLAQIDYEIRMFDVNLEILKNLLKDLTEEQKRSKDS